MFVQMPYAVLRVAPQASKVIQAYSTNRPVLGGVAFVDLKGRIIAMTEHIAINPDESLLVLHSLFTERLTAHLQKYLPLFESTIQSVPYYVYHDTDGSSGALGEYRVPFGCGSLILTKTMHESMDFGNEAYTLFRQQNNLPIQGVDYDDTMILNVDACNRYISYDKGCYLGQEIIARVHYKGRPPLKLMVSQEDPKSLSKHTMTSVATNPKNGFRQGFLLTPNVTA